MKFEDYLKEHKEKLNHSAPKQEIWEDISKTKFDAKTTAPRIIKWMRIAAVLVAISVAFYFFKQPKSTEGTNLHELASLKYQIDSLANGTKTSHRILAVSMVEEMEVKDDEIIGILIDRMQKDDSENVRLAAVRALTDFVYDETVRVAMLEELVKVKNPYIQKKLIDALSIYKHKKGLQKWDGLLEQKREENSLKSFGTKEI